jgi:hypothetical protein
MDPLIDPVCSTKQDQGVLTVVVGAMKMGMPTKAADVHQTVYHRYHHRVVGGTDCVDGSSLNNQHYFSIFPGAPPLSENWLKKTSGI